eukprot:TRINITY_DN7371_c0_g1_i2.p1 TRINITY_DN7371_c0_g1~~TRINITY_DN7371_c0_g1_i2.p1  ORF type:complete len:527 (-),score=87.13 TRINITY_DN7371_c0_g1_i2:215-1795(-)
MHRLKHSFLSPIIRQGITRIASRNFSTSPVVHPPPIFPKKPPLSSPFSSLQTPYPGIPEPSGLDPSSNEIHITKLHNGITVASLDYDSPITNVTVLIKTGSKYENETNYGINALIDRMFWKGSQRFSYPEINKVVDLTGAAIGSQVGREVEQLSMDVLTTKLPDMMQIIGDTVCAPLLNEETLQIGKENIPALYDVLISDPQHLVSDLLHKAAWGNQSYGNPIYPPDAEHITLETVEDYQRDFYVGERMVVVATGVKHDSFVNLCQKYFGSVHPSPRTPIAIPPSVFVGQELMVAKEENHPETPGYIPLNPKELIYLAFGVKMIGYNDKDYVTACLLDIILGGGFSFSAGGPGKGMLSLLYKEVLTKAEYVDSINSLYYPYEDQGLYGLIGSATAQKGHELISLMLLNLRNLDNKITPELFKRGINQLKGSVLMKLENRFLRTMDMGSQLLLSGKYKTAKEICQDIDNLTLKDLRNFIDRRLRDYSNSCFVGFGTQENMSGLPVFQDMKNYLHHIIQKKKKKKKKG